MKKNKIITLLMVALGVLGCLSFAFAKIEKDSDKDGLFDYEEQEIFGTDPQNPDTDRDSYQDALEIFHGYSPVAGPDAKLTRLNLEIPYINEAPDNNWTGPWKNACEEASMAMVEKFYLGKFSVTVPEAKTFMFAMFTRQNSIWGSNADSDAKRTAKLINDYTVYNASIKDNPTIEDIKLELQQKRPVITPLYGFNLNNPNIPFVPASQGGTSYHMLVVTGYDDITKEFITNDPGDSKQGDGYRYGYNLFMNALRDFDYNVRKVTGPARVIFTYPKLVKTIDSHRVYNLHGDIKQYISHPAVFAREKWSWDAVNVVTSEWLSSFKNGKDIK